MFQKFAAQVLFPDWVGPAINMLKEHLRRASMAVVDIVAEGANDEAESRGGFI